MNIENVKAMYKETEDVRRIDMVIGEKNYRSKGIGTVFVKMLIEYSFEHGNVDVLHCFSDDYNKRSQKIFQKNGFTLIFEEALPLNYKGKMTYHYRLTKNEYLNKK